MNIFNSLFVLILSHTALTHNLLPLRIFNYSAFVVLYEKRGHVNLL